MGIELAVWVVRLFGAFLIGVGFLMLLAPDRVRAIIRAAASTPVIHYSEITLRLIPAFGLIFSAEAARLPWAFQLLGGFMVATSAVLYAVPPRLHHRYALWCAEWLSPGRIRACAPLSMIFGGAVIHAVTAWPTG